MGSARALQAVAAIAAAAVALSDLRAGKPADPRTGKAASPAAEAHGGLARLPLKLPRPRLACTPPLAPPGGRIRLIRGPGKPRKPFYAPRGVENVALKRPVVSSDMDPIIGSLKQVTDGVKEGAWDAYVELGPGRQWVQIDLGRPCAIHAVVVRHEHHRLVVYHDVVVRIADDKGFRKNVRTLFHNDHDNSAGLGVGEDWKEYYETFEGLLVPAKGQRARYVRLYSKGSTSCDLNRYAEVEVYGLAKTAGGSRDATSARKLKAVPIPLKLPGRPSCCH